jgi:SSS family solute:Na+ symporter
MAAGSVVAVVMMIIEGLDANEPIFYGLGASLVAYLLVSALTPRTPANVLEAWSRRLAGEGGTPADDELTVAGSTAAPAAE